MADNNSSNININIKADNQIKLQQQKQAAVNNNKAQNSSSKNSQSVVQNNNIDSTKFIEELNKSKLFQTLNGSVNTLVTLVSTENENIQQIKETQVTFDKLKDFLNQKNGGKDGSAAFKDLPDIFAKNTFFQNLSQNLEDINTYFKQFYLQNSQQTETTSTQQSESKTDFSEITNSIQSFKQTINNISLKLDILTPQNIISKSDLSQLLSNINISLSEDSTTKITDSIYDLQDSINNFIDNQNVDNNNLQILNNINENIIHLQNDINSLSENIDNISLQTEQSNNNSVKTNISIPASLNIDIKNLSEKTKTESKESVVNNETEQKFDISKIDLSKLYEQLNTKQSIINNIDIQLDSNIKNILNSNKQNNQQNSQKPAENLDTINNITSDMKNKTNSVMTKNEQQKNNNKPINKTQTTSNNPNKSEQKENLVKQNGSTIKLQEQQLLSPINESQTQQKPKSIQKQYNFDFEKILNNNTNTLTQQLGFFRQSFFDKIINKQEKPKQQNIVKQDTSEFISVFTKFTDDIKKQNVTNQQSSLQNKPNLSAESLQVSEQKSKSTSVQSPKPNISSVGNNKTTPEQTVKSNEGLTVVDNKTTHEQTAKQNEGLTKQLETKSSDVSVSTSTDLSTSSIAAGKNQSAALSSQSQQSTLQSSTNGSSDIPQKTSTSYMGNISEQQYSKVINSIDWQAEIDTDNSMLNDMLNNTDEVQSSMWYTCKILQDDKQEFQKLCNSNQIKDIQKAIDLANTEKNKIYKDLQSWDCAKAAKRKTCLAIIEKILKYLARKKSSLIEIENANNLLHANQNIPTQVKTPELPTVEKSTTTETSQSGSTITPTQIKQSDNSSQVFGNIDMPQNLRKQLRTAQAQAEDQFSQVAEMAEQLFTDKKQNNIRSTVKHQLGNIDYEDEKINAYLQNFVVQTLRNQGLQKKKNVPELEIKKAVDNAANAFDKYIQKNQIAYYKSDDQKTIKTKNISQLDSENLENIQVTVQQEDKERQKNRPSVKRSMQEAQAKFQDMLDQILDNVPEQMQEQIAGAAIGQTPEDIKLPDTSDNTLQSNNNSLSGVSQVAGNPQSGSTIIPSKRQSTTGTISTQTSVPTSKSQKQYLSTSAVTSVSNNTPNNSIFTTNNDSQQGSSQNITNIEALSSTTISQSLPSNSEKPSVSPTTTLEKVGVSIPEKNIIPSIPPSITNNEVNNSSTTISNIQQNALNSNLPTMLQSSAQNITSTDSTNSVDLLVKQQGKLVEALPQILLAIKNSGAKPIYIPAKPSGDQPNLLLK